MLPLLGILLAAAARAAGSAAGSRFPPGAGASTGILLGILVGGVTALDLAWPTPSAYEAPLAFLALIVVGFSSIAWRTSPARVATAPRRLAGGATLLAIGAMAGEGGIAVPAGAVLAFLAGLAAPARASRGSVCAAEAVMSITLMLAGAGLALVAPASRVVAIASALAVGAIGGELATGRARLEAPAWPLAGVALAATASAWLLAAP